MEGQAVIRLLIAVGCAGMLILARWQHERLRWFGASQGRRRAVWAQHGRVTWSLYWLGLTTSAALAGQAVAMLAAP
ncbi:MAG: hypothetical protein CL878_14515 [Dehalococcoidia bacterium]|nr:hypothetical protein [Dehalococcoidia bacterium]